MRSFIGIISFLTLTLISTNGLSQSKLDKSKEEINKGKRTENNRSTQSQSRSNAQSNAQSNAYSGSSSDEKTFGQLIGEGIGEIFKYLVYYSIVGEYKTEQHLHSRVTKYPYYNNHSGNYENADSNLHLKNRFRFELDYQFIYSNKNELGNHFKCNIRPFQYFYLQAQYHQLSEHTTNNTKADLSLFNFNFCYDRIRFEKFNLGWKLGMCYISNNVNKGGFSAGLDAEAFIVKPFSLYVSKQWGGIHNVPVNEFEIAARFYKKRYNIHLGYEHLKIGSPLYDYISVGAGIHL